MPIQQMTDIMQRLKDETLVHHQRSEQRPLEQALINGTLPQEAYVALLKQRFFIHRALEQHLQEWVARDSTWGTVVHCRQFQEPHLRADLEFFGVDPSLLKAIGPTTDMVRCIDRVAATDPVSLLGFHYVFEGSKNGARFVARSAQQAYGLSTTGGTSYFDPHGEQQRPLWLAFKEAMEALSLTPLQADGIVTAAQQAFDGMSKIDDAICEAHCPQRVTAE